MARTESTWDPSSRETILLFFFQAEDGIRDLTVTGVQTCALPISRGLFLTGEAPARHWLPAARLHRRQRPRHLPRRAAAHARGGVAGQSLDGSDDRSEEGRVGEEGRFRWAAYHLKKKNKDVRETRY